MTRTELVEITSGDQSVVFSDPSQDWVEQKFHSKSTYNSVQTLATLIQETSTISVCFDGEENYFFSPETVLVKMIAVNEKNNSIRWQRVHCLNELSLEDRKIVIRKNWFKFFWDILRALHTLRKLGYEHGDATLDNIGIRDDHFVLYDFNLSKKQSKRYFESFKNDLYRTVRSLRFHFDQDLTIDEASFLKSMEQMNSLHDLFHVIRSTPKQLDELIFTYLA